MQYEQEVILIANKTHQLHSLMKNESEGYSQGEGGAQFKIFSHLR